MARSRVFWNLMAANYARQPIADEEAYRHKLQTTQELFQPHMRVLEIGCGTGSTAILHAPLVKTIHAVDYSRKMIDIAREKARDAGVNNITFETSPIEELEAPKQSYDAVLGMSILHLLEQPASVLDKIYNWLKPGGFFASSTVCAGELGSLERFFLPIGSALRVLPHVAQLTAKTLAKDISEAGFDIEYSWRPQPKSALFIIARKPLAG